jgi:amino acid adenylation domain-containing protein
MLPSEPPTAHRVDPAKRQWIDRQLAWRREFQQRLPLVRHDAGADSWPLSRIQQSMWFVQQQSPRSTSLHTHFLFKIHGDLDRHALDRAFIDLLGTHEMLRMGVRHAGEEVRAYLRPLPETVLEFTDLSEAERPAEAAEAAIRDRSNQAFSLERDLLLRALLLRTANCEHLLCIIIHHLADDGWSFPLILDALSAHYGARVAGVESPVKPPQWRYADYVASNEAWLDSGECDEVVRAWQTRLEGCVPPALPEDLRGQVVDGPGTQAAVHLEIPPQLVDQLRRLAQDYAATLAAVMLAAYKALLRRWTGESDITVGLPAANRAQQAFRDVVGPFLNLLPVRATVDADLPFDQLLGMTRDHLLETVPYQCLPLEELLRRLKPERDSRGQAYFNTLFNFHREDPLNLRLRGCEVESLMLLDPLDRYALAVRVAAGTVPGSLVVDFQYNDRLLLPATAQRLAARYRRMLEEIVAAPQRRIADLDLWTPGEREQVNEWSRGPVTDYPRNAGLAQLFADAARRHAGKVAVVDGERSWTYAELDAASARAAARLAQAGLQPGGVVGLHLQRSAGFMVAMLGVLRAGGIYMPIDPQQPPGRSRYMLDTAGARLVISAEPGADEPAGGCRSIALAALLEPGTAAPAVLPPATAPGGAAVANIMFTSGSTGEPKGIEVTHRGIVRLVCGAAHNVLGPDSVCLFSSSVSFDAATWEIWGSLLNGSRMVVLPPQSHDTRELAALIRRHGITHVSLTTALFHVFVEEAPDAFRGLQAMIVGGEALQREAALRFLREVPGTLLVNTYGPTENTTDSTWLDIPADLDPMVRTIPIGRPIANSSAFVLDAKRRLCPVGEPGELYLGGDGLACGYIGRDDLTRAAFIGIEADFHSGRLYRSGDLCRWLENGTLEFIGRADHQVKYRGYRIELDEIAIALKRHPLVEDAVAILQSDRTQPRLLAAAASSAGIDESALRAHLSRHLPPYMVPARVGVVDRIPLSPAGKVDRRAVEALFTESAAPGARSGPAAASADAGLTPLEARIAGVWREILDVEEVRPEDSLMALGAHSLMLVRIRVRLERLLGRPVPIALLFSHPVLRDFAEQVAASPETAGAAGVTDAITAGQAPPELPLSWPQRLIWIGGRTATDSALYNITLAWRLTGAVDCARLEAALARMARRHESLRTAFTSRGDGDPRQRVLPELAGPFLQARQLGHEPLDTFLDAFAGEPFDLAVPPLFRCCIATDAAGNRLFAWAGHHIVFDGWSVERFFAELEQLHANPAGALPDPPIQYRDFTAWQLSPEVTPRLESSLSWWRHYLGGLPPQDWTPALPPQASRPRDSGGAIDLTLDAALTARLRAYARACRLSLTDLFMGAFSAVCSQLGNLPDICIGLPVAGRGRVELEELIGTFVNTLPLRLKVEPQLAFGSWMQRVHEALHRCYLHEETPFARLCEQLEPGRHPAPAQLLAALITVHEHGAPGRDLLGQPAEPVPIPRNTSKAPLTLSINAAGTDLRCRLEYDARLFSRESAQALADACTRLLEASAGDPSIRLDAVAPGAEPPPAADRGGFAADANVYRRFHDTALRHAGRVALAWSGGRMTYAELERAVTSAAARLHRLGARPGDRIGTLAVRDPRRIIAELAILRLGAVYVPLDPATPAGRLQDMAERTGMRLACVFEGCEPGMAGSLGAVRAEDVTADGPAGDEPAPPAAATGADDPAYVMFTSGSTGRPKGVVVPHRAILRLVVNADYVQCGPDDVFAHLANPAFDAVTFEIWGALLNGGRVVIYSRGQALDHKGFTRALARDGVTHLFLTTALLHVIAAENPAALAPVRNVLFGGEKADPERVRAILEAGPPARLLHVYGPTENTTFSTWHPVAPGDPDLGDIPIGTAIAGSDARVCSAWGRTLPPGFVGELRVGGEGLARGYLNDPQATAAAFTGSGDSAPGDTARRYRTGDMVWRDSGDRLRFVGRRDGQVKLRGHRIELGEIEAALTRHPRVRMAAVSLCGDSAEQRRMVAFMVPEGPEALPDAAELRQFLGRWLPDYMLPAGWMPLDAIPLNANGKTDHARLRQLAAAAPAAVTPAASPARPPTPLEQQLIYLWNELLPAGCRHAEEDFFQLGGNSLLALRLLARIEKQFNAVLDFGSLALAPTIAQLAGRITADGPLTLGSQPVLPLQPHGDATPLIGVYGHGFHSSPFVWKSLSDYLGRTQPVYGIQGGGMDGRPIPEQSMEELAGRHARDLAPLIQQRGGVLIGYCTGGYLAYAIACALEALQTPVARLVLVDSLAPGPRVEWSRGERRRRWLRHREALRTEGPRHIARWLSETARARLRTWRRRRHHQQAARIADQQLIPEALRADYMEKTLARLFEAWQPTPYSGPVHLLRSAGSDELPDDFGWRPFVRGPFQSASIPVPHHMMDDAHFQAVADAVRQTLDA